MNLLAVDAAELVAIGGPLAVPSGNARGVTYERLGVALRLEAEGLVGWGECTPMPGISPDRLDEGAAALGRALAGELPRIDLDEPFRDIAAWVERIPANLPAARFALDTALLDLSAQAYDCPIGHLIGEGRTPVLASAMVELEDWPREIERAVAERIGTFKIKVGRGGAGRLPAEIAALGALRQAYPHATLRFDANGAFGARGAPSALAELARLEPEWVEQPVPPGMLCALEAPPCPIAADESAGADDDDLWRAVHRGIVSVLVIKPALVGGLLAAVELSERARSLGLDVVVSHMLDGPIALAAAAELAVGLGGARAAGVGEHGGLSAFPPIQVPQLQGGALISCGPGLGVAYE